MVDRGIFGKQYHTPFVGIPALVPIQSPSSYSHRQILGPSFQPSNWDVICHNAKEYQDHSEYCARPTAASFSLLFIMLIRSVVSTGIPPSPFATVGNKRFKICIENHLGGYTKAPSRIAKSVIITNIVNSIRDSSTQPCGGFVRFDTSCGLWYEVGDKIARDKVGQALRNVKTRIESQFQLTHHRRRRRRRHHQHLLIAMVHVLLQSPSSSQQLLGIIMRPWINVFDTLKSGSTTTRLPEAFSRMIIIQEIAFGSSSMMHRPCPQKVSP